MTKQTFTDVRGKKIKFDPEKISPEGDEKALKEKPWEIKACHPCPENETRHHPWPCTSP
ncbi:MAG: hypothetical protein V1851_00120 [Patescibacteria group bacterium]